MTRFTLDATIGAGAATVHALGCIGLAKQGMAMTPNQRREEISKAYVAAVAAQCGFKLGHWCQDDDCLDVTIGAAGIVGYGTLAGPKLDIQLKATSDSSHVHETHISWQLAKQHYDRLRRASCVPIVLVVLVLPSDEREWVEHYPESLILRRCAYWKSLLDSPEITSNSRESTAVHIPKENVFAPLTLRNMMKKISREEDL